MTLARELSAEEIEKIAEASSIELEVFVHGALCFSYSGQCLMASMAGGRSGNRGLCPQVCRLPYAIEKAEGLSAAREKPRSESGRSAAGKRILSTRDLCAIRLLQRLAGMGIASIKIEGRLKSPDYVAAVTQVYRKALDRLGAGEALEVGEDDMDELALAHSRGFTEGYMVGIRDDRLMSPGRSSDRGLMVGRVAFVDLYSGRVGIALQRCLKLGDVVEIWVSRGGRIRQKVDFLEVEGRSEELAEPRRRAVIKVSEKRHLIGPGDRVFLIRRQKRGEIRGRKKVPIEMRAVVAEGEPIRVKASAPDAEIEVQGGAVAERARKSPVSSERVSEQLSKLGGTVYQAAKVEVAIKGRPSVPVSEINEVRRKMVGSLDEARTLKYQKECRKAKCEPSAMTARGFGGKPKSRRVALSVSVSDLRSASAAISAGADRVYLSLWSADENAKRASVNLPLRVRPSLGNIVKDSEIPEVVEIVKSVWGEGIALCDNLGIAVALRNAGFEVALDYHVNVMNGLTCAELADLAPAGITASVEADVADIEAMRRESPVPVEVVAHGSVKVMTSEHELPEARDRVEGERARFEIRDSRGFRFPTVVDPSGRTHIYNAKELSLLEELPKIADAGAAAIRLLLDLYSEEEVSVIVSAYRRALDHLSTAGSLKVALEAAKKAHWSFSDHTTGHFYRPVI